MELSSGFSCGVCSSSPFIPRFVVLQSFVCFHTDIAGQERYGHMTGMFYRESQIAIVGYDVTNRRTMECCKYWIHDVWSKVGDGCTIVTVGNKIDYLDMDQRKASKEEAVLFFEKELGIASDHCFQVSAKTGEGVTELFTSALRFWMKSHQTLLDERKKMRESSPQIIDRSEVNQKSCIVM